MGRTPCFWGSSSAGAFGTRTLGVRATQRRLRSGACTAACAEMHVLTHSPHRLHNLTQWGHDGCSLVKPSKYPRSTHRCPSLHLCRLHILTDGRDVPDGSSLRFVAELEALLQELQVGR